jgi:hypothetical protein
MEKYNKCRVDWGQKASAAKGFYKGHRDIAEKALHHFIKAYST